MPAPDRPGVYTATPTLTAGGAEHAIPIGQLQVFKSEDALPHDVAEPLSGIIALLKEQQWSMPFGVAVAERREIPRTIPVAGEIIAPGSGLAYVSTLVAGVMVAGGPSPAPGCRVEAGQTLTLIAPTSLDNSYARMRAERPVPLLQAERVLHPGRQRLSGQLVVVGISRDTRLDDRPQIGSARQTGEVFMNVRELTCRRLRDGSEAVVGRSGGYSGNLPASESPETDDLR